MCWCSFVKRSRNFQLPLFKTFDESNAVIAIVQHSFKISEHVFQRALRSDQIAGSMQKMHRKFSEHRSKLYDLYFYQLVLSCALGDYPTRTAHSWKSRVHPQRRSTPLKPADGSSNLKGRCRAAIFGKTP